MRPVLLHSLHRHGPFAQQQSYDTDCRSTFENVFKGVKNIIQMQLLHQTRDKVKETTQACDDRKGLGYRSIYLLRLRLCSLAQHH